MVYLYMDYYYKSPIGRKAIKLHTVNVLEFANNEFQQSFSFADNPEGNKRAEKQFARLVREHNPRKSETGKITAEDIEDMLDEGVYDDQFGYQVLITHSL